MKKFLFPFPREYFPAPNANRMKNTGDLKLARESFFENKPNNLTWLLSSRFTWMNKFSHNLSSIIEVGAGTGFSKEFIHNKEALTQQVEELSNNLEVISQGPVLAVIRL